MLEYIDATLLRKMFLAAAGNLDSKKAWINELNVFPVPDGDTGTNMTLTIMSAVKELEKLPANAGIGDICKQIATGTLRGARGNSGVILSQLCRGFAKVAGEAGGKLDKKTFAEAFNYAVATAYKAVMKPKEGTILTVAKAASFKANELADADISLADFFNEVNKYAEFILGKTPEMLPVLKEAGVVDSGGQGLVEVLKGAYSGYMGLEDIPEVLSAPAQSRPKVPGVVDSSDIETADIKFGYCTEFIIKLEKDYTEKDEADFKEFLGSIGDSLVVVSMDDIVKVHVHTNHPGEAFEKGLTFGQLTSMKVDNLWEEHNEKVILEADRALAAQLEAGKTEKAADADGSDENKKAVSDKKPAPGKKYGFVAVCAGEGIADIYRELGIDAIIEGGQTMNPSTEDILAAIDSVDAENVFVFPNNGNIIMAARQAVSLYEGKNVIIIPTRTIIEGISAMIAFDQDGEPEGNEAGLNEAIDAVETAEITYAVRDTELYGKKISNGDFMGIGEGSILAVGKELASVAIETVKAMATETSELITVYYGKDVTKDAAQELALMIESQFREAEVDIVYGGQPVYYYYISVE